MAKESPCRNDCGMMLHFDKNFKTETGKWIPLEPDDTPHQCPNSSYNLKNATRTVATAATQQVQQHQQRQEEPQGQSRYETSYLIPREDWNKLQSNINTITLKLNQLSEYYGDLLDHLRSRNQKMADAEAQYDQDKEDGSLYGEQ